VGLDFARPLNIVNEHADGSSKVYVCLFTCASTRTVHLELCKGSVVQDFLLAFRRFASRRGLPATITSDKAKRLSLRAKKSEGSQDPTNCCVTLLIKESPGTSSVNGLPGWEVSGSAVALWLVRSSPDRAVRVRALARGHCVVFLGKTLNSHVPLSTQMISGYR